MKTSTLLVVLALFMGLSLPASANDPGGWSSSDKTVFVSVNGNDLNNGLSFDHAKATINGAVTALPSGGVIQFGAGTFNATGTVTLISNLTFRGAGRDLTIIQPANGTNLFSVSTVVASCLFEDLRLAGAAGTGGDIFNFANPGGGMSQSKFTRVYFTQTNTAKHILYAADASNFVEVRFEGCEFHGLNTHTVPLVYLVSSNNGINLNVFANCRVSNAGNYAFQLESISGSGYANDNVFRNINIEGGNGAAIKILSGNNTIIENVVLYDPPDDTTQDSFYIGKAGQSGLASINTLIRNSGRRGGTTYQNSSVDIRLESGNAPRTTIENFDNAVSTAPIIDAGSNSQLVVRGMLSGTTVQNPSTSMVRYDVNGIRFGEDTLLARSSAGKIAIEGSNISTVPVPPFFSTLGTEVSAINLGNNMVNTAANDAMAISFVPRRAMTVAKLAWVSGPTVSGNYDIGIYDNNGTALWRKGVTAFPAATTLKVETVSPTVYLSAGVKYNILWSSDTTTAQIKGNQAAIAGMGTNLDGSPTARSIANACNFPTSGLPASVTLGSTAASRHPYVELREQ